MKAQFTDSQIAVFLAEKKPIPANYRDCIQLRQKRGHKERELSITGADGNEFRLILRQSEFNPLDFSTILGLQIPKSNQMFRLRRYNGKSHEHTNPLEEETFYGFHIHKATERYQLSGFREDTFAEKTERYADFQGAIQCMLEDCAIEVQPNP